MARKALYGVKLFRTWRALYQYYLSKFSKGHKQWIFKGLADSSWYLRTTLERAFIRYSAETVNGKEKEEKLNTLYRKISKSGMGDRKKRPLSDIEKGLLRDFKRKCHHYLQDVPPERCILEWLTLMQHHGAPTRLLDFTYSFFVALYFAIEDADGECAVWAIDSDWLSRKNRGLCDKATRRDFDRLTHATTRRGQEKFFRRFFWESTTARVEVLNAYRLNQRLIIQQGVFLCPGDISVPFMDNLCSLIGDHPNHDKFVKLRIRLKAGERETVLQHLHRMNITRATLFPGLDGFAKSLTNLLIFPDILRPEIDEVCKKNMIEEMAFIAFWDSSGKSERARDDEPSPPYIHRLRRSGRSPALPYPPSRRDYVTPCKDALQKPRWHPQSEKRSFLCQSATPLGNPPK